MSSSLSQLWDEFTELSRSAKAPHLRFELITPQPRRQGGDQLAEAVSYPSKAATASSLSHDQGCGSAEMVSPTGSWWSDKITPSRIEPPLCRPKYLIASRNKM